MKTVFIHGLEGSSQGNKARLLQRAIPGILIPEFEGSLQRRMAHLRAVLLPRFEWLLIGSSYGGLMAVLYASQFPDRVRKLILLAPAVVWPDLEWSSPAQIKIPTVIYHGSDDQIIPVEAVSNITQELFENVVLHVVNDDHSLHRTAHEIDWPKLLAEE